jgi:hypothetical protein
MCRFEVCRFAMDRTPLQRMLTAAALHSLRPCLLYPPPSQEAALSSSYRGFQRLGKLPAALDDDDEDRAATAEDESLLWHVQRSNSSLTKADLEKMNDFKLNFVEVRPRNPCICSSFAMYTNSTWRVSSSASMQFWESFHDRATLSCECALNAVTLLA